MRDATDLLALYDDLSPDDEAVLRSALDDAPELRDAGAHWARLRGAVRAGLSRDLSDRDLLVLHALADDANLLTPEERTRLDASGVAEAVSRHPGLAAAVGRIRDDRDAFEAAWDQHASGETPMRAPLRPERAASRPAAVPARQRPTRWAWRATAIASVVFFGAVLTFLYGRDAGFERIVAKEQTTVALADGSEATLAPGSVLMVPRASGERDPRQARLMAGTVLFDIVRDPEAPFEVQTPNAEVTVLGTTFSVEVTEIQQKDATRVVLASGKVQLAPRAKPAEAVTLSPGEEAAVVRFDAPEAPRLTDVAADLAWTGTLYARELSAAEVARRIAQVTGARVIVDAELAGEPVSGTFHTDRGAEPALRTLTLALDADLLRTADGFRLAR